MDKVAILVDGGFYRVRAKRLFGKTQTPAERADELEAYCLKHALHAKQENGRELYRVFYYDCPPVATTVRNPITGLTDNLATRPTYKWTEKFFEELIYKKMFAIRRGRLTKPLTGYILTPQAQKKFFNGQLNVTTLQQSDLRLDIGQKGVDMRLGIDLVQLATKRLVDQVVLIAGDSDFVPAVKIARREGVKIILDNMNNNINPELQEHIDETLTFVDDSQFLATYRRLPSQGTI